jgi:hypothetical protein
MVAQGRIAAAPASAPRHTAALRGLSLGGAPSDLPTILERRDQDFINGLLDELTRPGGVNQLGGRRLSPTAGEARLYQPIHRVFNLVLFELDCLAPGQPPIPAERIESAGLVLRRMQAGARSHTAAAEKGQSPGLRSFITARKRARQLPSPGEQVPSTGEQVPPAGEQVLDGQFAAEDALLSDLDATALVAEEMSRAVQVRAGTAPGLEGWMVSQRSLRGWLPLAGGADELDPDPVRRPPERRSGHPTIDLLLQQAGAAPLGESISPLFVAPPQVCAAAGRTLLYGLVPVTSIEQSEVDAALPAMSAETVARHLPIYLRAGGPYAVPAAGQTLTYLNARSARGNPLNTGETDELVDLIRALTQIGIELDAFGTTTAARRVYQALNAIQLPFRDSSNQRFFRPAGDFLKDAFRVLVELDGIPNTSGLPALKMPDFWPEVTSSQAAAILGGAQGTVQAQLSKAAGREGRFDDPARAYCLRAFVRLKMPPDESGDCPPELVWSEYSQPFTIIPWYEGSGAPPVQVNLPDVTDPQFLRGLTPNVSFTVPAGLFNLLNRNNPKDFLDGSAVKAGGQALDWICSFNIPIITICAFIVLNIFLQLFNFIFQWLMFIKICIPFPRPK